MNTQPEAMRLADELDWRHEVDPINIKAATELRRLHAEVSRLQAWHQTAWQRGHAVGLNGLSEALRQMEDHKKSDAWGNTQLTEALMRAEEQRDELLEALENLLWYVGQLEMIVYSADDTGEHEEVTKARAVINKAKKNEKY